MFTIRGIMRGNSGRNVGTSVDHKKAKPMPVLCRGKKSAIESSNLLILLI